MHTIRIDKDVYDWLKSKAEPFEDTPNSVLRKLAGLEKNKADIDTVDLKDDGREKKMDTIIANKPLNKRLNGKYLSKLWNVNAKHKLYHHEGTFYENLHDFPGALFDLNGYVIFNTEQEYKTCPYLDIGLKLNVRQGIYSIPGYKRMR